MSFCQSKREVDKVNLYKVTFTPVRWRESGVSLEQFPVVSGGSLFSWTVLLNCRCFTCLSFMCFCPKPSVSLYSLISFSRRHLSWTGGGWGRGTASVDWSRADWTKRIYLSIKRRVWRILLDEWVRVGELWPITAVNKTEKCLFSPKEKMEATWNWLQSHDV